MAPTNQDSVGSSIPAVPQPAEVRPLSVLELKSLLEQGQIRVFDVRPAFERSLASLASAVALDEAGQALLMSLPKDSPIAMLCHHGVRSHFAAQQLAAIGFRNLFNVEGGIDAWSVMVDPLVPRY